MTQVPPGLATCSRSDAIAFRGASMPLNILWRRRMTRPRHSARIQHELGEKQLLDLSGTRTGPERYRNRRRTGRLSGDVVLIRPSTLKGHDRIV